MIRNSYEYLLIAIEGLGGVGKTSTINFIVDRINEMVFARRADKLSEDIINIVLSRLSDIINVEETRNFLAKLRIGGAIRFEDIKMNYPTRDILSSLGDNMSVSFYSYLLTALYKDLAIRALLPYVNVISDRYVYSIIAHHLAYGVDVESLDLDHYDILAPDFCFHLIANECVRQKRLGERGGRRDRDKLVKGEDGIIERMEGVFVKHLPIIVDTSDRSVSEVAEWVMGYVEEGGGGFK